MHRLSWLRKLGRWASSNPTIAVGAVALVTYVELRVTAEVFYEHFSVTAEEAGFGGIDVALQQSAVILLLYALIGIATSILYLLFGYPIIATSAIRKKLAKKNGEWKVVASVLIPYVALFGFVLTIQLGTVAMITGALGLAALCVGLPEVMFWKYENRRRDVRRRLPRYVRNAAAIGLLASPLILLTLSIPLAGGIAEDIRAGYVPDEALLPWHIHPVTAVWKVPRPPLRLPDCRHLTYLGEGGGRVLLYDQSAGRTLRIASTDLELSFPDRC